VRRPLRANEWAKLIATVVLPTPPFWLEIAIVITDFFLKSNCTPPAGDQKSFLFATEPARAGMPFDKGMES
jgi:hypothetical protein